jgi:carbonic anhydrase
MSAIDDVLQSNERYASGFDLGDLPGAPAKKLAIVTCMDARLNVHKALGLEEGDAHVIRNAGAVITDDEIRSLAISQHFLGTEEIMVIDHTRCGLLTFTDDEFNEKLRDETGEEPEWNAGTFNDLDQDVRDSVRRIEESPFIPRTDVVRGFIYEVETGRLREVV